MPKNIKEIMIALNKVLTTTVWVNEDRQIISLADELKIGHNNAPRSIEDLPRASLVGAYVSLQIRTDNFEIAAESMDTKTLAWSLPKRKRLWTPPISKKSRLLRALHNAWAAAGLNQGVKTVSGNTRRKGVATVEQSPVVIFISDKVNK